MTFSPELVTLGRAHMDLAHEVILVAAALGLFGILAGLASRRVGAPILLVFLVLGMLAGEDGPGGIRFDDFYSAYLIGSVALAAILFDGGIKTRPAMLHLAAWPALALAVIGVAVTAGVVALAVMWLANVPFAMAMLFGAAVAPTDAAAVGALLGRARLALPERVTALLEVESGLNDPMSIFLTIFVIHVITDPASATWSNAALLFAREMIGGTVLGIAGGWVLGLLLRRLLLEAATAMVLVLAFGLALFGLAQVVGTSGFLAIYITGVITGTTSYRDKLEVAHFMEGFAWLAQIILFLMLGLLVTPHDLLPFVPVGVIVAIVLIVIARPVAVFACLLPFRFAWRESAFASWVGLRGAVPIYLSIIPALADPGRDARLFSGVFVVVVVSLVIQGWTIGAAARLLGFGRAGMIAAAKGCGIIVAGDPHGNFAPILRACAGREPGTLILLGDCELRVPLRRMLAPLFAAGWRVHWILGNKDAETEAVFDNLAVDFPEGDIGGKVVQVDQLLIAGLGGVFKPRIWDPGADQHPSFTTRRAFLASLDPRDHWRGGLPLWHRDSIFPEDFAALEQHRFDVLITHEAPSCHRHGFAAIDRLADVAMARLIVHGHHHESYTATLPGGTEVRGLAVAETYDMSAPLPLRGRGRGAERGG